MNQKNIENTLSMWSKQLKCMYWVTADIPITITGRIIQIPVESARIRAIIPIRTEFSYLVAFWSFGFDTIAITNLI